MICYSDSKPCRQILPLLLLLCSDLSQADDVAVLLLQDGFDKRHDLSSGTLGLGWKSRRSAFGGEEEHQRSATDDGSNDFPSQGA